MSGPYEVGSYASFTDFEEIHDVGRSRRKLSKVHPVLHRRIKGTLGKYPSWLDTNQVVSDFYPPVSPDQLFSFVPAIDQATLDKLHVRAFDQLHDQFTVVSSVPNFFYELRELPQLLPKLVLMRNHLFGLAHSLNNGYLSYQFGWKPLLSDIQKLQKDLLNYLDRLEYLRSTYGKPTRVHFRANNVHNPPASAGVHDITPFGDQRLYATLVDHVVSYSAGGIMYHRLKGLDSDTAALRAFLSATGFNNPVKVLWNAIPYSFLVDWFTNAIDLFTKRAASPFEGEISIEQTTWSLRYRSQFEIHAHPYASYGNPRVKIGHYWVDVYDRKLDLPAVDYKFFNSALSPTQLSLIGSLIFGQARPRS